MLPTGILRTPGNLLLFDQSRMCRFWRKVASRGGGEDLSNVDVMFVEGEGVDEDVVEIGDDEEVEERRRVSFMKF